MASSYSVTLFNTACFTCKEQNSNSFLNSSYFEKLIYFNLGKDEISDTKFFGKVYPAYSCMWINMQELFLEVKRTFMIVKSLLVDNTSSLKNNFMFVSVENFRMDILKVLKFFLTKVQAINLKYSNLDSKNTYLSRNKQLNSKLVLLLKEIKNLLLFVGHISSVPGVSNIRDFHSDSCKTALYFYHYYHLCLDIWFICLGIVYSISLLLPKSLGTEAFCDIFDQSCPFLQLASLLIYELSCLALNRYKNDSISKSLPFSCQCTKEFWIILMHLIEKSDSFGTNTTFWSVYQSVLQTILKNSSSYFNHESSVQTFSISSIQLPKESSIEACFWITSHVALFYQYNYTGQVCRDIQPKSGYATLKYLIHSLFNASNTSEKYVRCVVSYCIPLVSIWEVRGEILLPLTDFFIKKIEETFCIQSTDISGLSYLFKDSLSWLSYISNLSSSNQSSRVSSFDHFLQILQIQVKRDLDNTLWRTLKGRIYSKYFPKKIKEISEIGLQNTLSLFLAVAASNQFEISSKISEVVSVIESTANYRKQLITWKAVFVLLYIYQERKQTIQNIASLMSSFFDSACSDYSKIRHDSMLKANLMSLLLIYIDNLDEIFKRKPFLDSTLCQLITKGFSILLPSCSVSEVNYILGVFNSILRNIMTTVESGELSDEIFYAKIIEAVFNNVYPFVENIALTDTPPIVVSDIAVALTKIVSIISTGFNCLPPVYKIFMYFGCKENVNSTITSYYLSFILDCSDIMNEMKLKVEDLDRILLQSWLKCTIYMHTECEYMNKFTEKVLKTNPIVAEFVSLEFDVCNQVKASIHLYQLMGKTYNSSNLQKKAQMAQNLQKVFKNFAFYAINKIRKAKDSDSFIHVYKLISHLILNCSVVLHHHVTSDHVLLELLDKTIYPQILFPKDKTLQSLVSNSVKEHLPNILKGLFKLEYRKDKSVEREIRDITMYYISALPTSNNPIVKLMLDTVMKKHGEWGVDAYQFILEVLKSSFLSNNAEKPTCILELYQEIFRLTPPDCKTEITDVLLKCCLEVFMKRNDSFSESMRMVLKKALLYFKEKMPYSYTKVILIPIIQWFVVEKLQWSVMRGFSVLDIFVDFLPQLISDIMSFLTTSVETLEKNRGIGEDMLLRNGLRNIVFKVQQKLCK